MSIKSTTLTSTAANLLAGSTGERAVTVIYLYNSDSAAVDVSLHAVPSGGTADASNLIYGNLSITAGDTYIVDSEKMLLDDGDGIYASAGTDNVVIATISYATL
jgi:hypothetical protein